MSTHSIPDAEAAAPQKLVNPTPRPQHELYANYSAYESFNPVYRTVWPDLLAKFAVPDARIIYFVLLAHLSHCNEIGIHFAGVDEIAAISCYGVGSVLRAEKTLAQLDWLRMHWIAHDPTHPRRRVPRYQVSPRVIWIAQPSIADAEAWWQCGIAFDRAKPAKQKYYVSRNGQPESESESEPETTTRTKNQNQQPQQNFSNAKGQTRKRPDAATEVPLSKCEEPCADQRDESLAQKIAIDLRTHLNQARQIVLSYGAAATVQAIDAMLVEASRGKEIKKPAGFVLAHLRRQSAAAAPASAAGRYSDMFVR